MSWIYALAYYAVILFCATQSFYPIFMLLAMFLRQSKLFFSFFHKVDTSSTKHGGELVAQVFKSHGVSNIFTLPGGHVSPITVAAHKLNIRIVDVRHEATAVFAADASARISGIPGVAVVTAGPGLTNTVTAIKNAQLAESPIVVVAGAAATMLKGRGSLQDIDQISLLKTATKQCLTVDCVRDIVPTMREAFRIAQVGIPGPVFVELPVDILYPYSIISKQFASMSNKQSSSGSAATSTTGSTNHPDGSNKKLTTKKLSLLQRIVNLYSEYKLKHIFSEAFIERDTDPLPISIKSPSDNQVKKVSEILRNAKRPLIIAGSQSVLGPFGGEVIANSLRELGIPVFVNGSARGLLGANYELQFRHFRKEAVKEADCVLLLGATCDFRLSYGQIFNKSSKIIAVNRSKDLANLNAGIFWNPTMIVESDVGKFVKELEASLNGVNNKLTAIETDWLEQLQKRDSAKEASIDGMAAHKADKHLNPLRVLTELRKVIEADDRDVVLVADGGDFVASASYIVKTKKPLRWLDPGPFGTLGCGAGFAMAAKLLLPNATVISIMGDGAFGYAIPELDSFVRHKLATMWLIGNDACWTQIVREQVPMLGSPIGCELAFTDYHKVALGFGAHGHKLDNESHLPMIGKAREQADKGDTVVVNALIGKTTFRDGSISV